MPEHYGPNPNVRNSSTLMVCPFVLLLFFSANPILIKRHKDPPSQQYNGCHNLDTDF